MYKQYLAVMIGGALGAGGRYGVSVWMTADPWKVLLINWIGCFVLGFFTAFAARTGRVSDVVRAGFGTGVMGGFTTFSTFSLDVVKLMEQGLWLDLMLYIVGSLVGGVVLAWGGAMLGRRAGSSRASGGKPSEGAEPTAATGSETDISSRSGSQSVIGSTEVKN